MNKQEENLDFEISFFEQLLKEDPDFLDVLIPLAEDYTKRGLYKKGLETDLKISTLKPNDPLVYYNLACSYSLTQNTEAALNYLEKALNLGYDDFEWLEKDPDLISIKQNPKYYSIVQKFQKFQK